MATIYYNADIDIEVDEIINEIPTKNLVEELDRRTDDSDARKNIIKLISEIYPQKSVQDKFDSSPTDALNVLQDLLGMQHTATKEQVIERLKSVL
jgi:hypothetical protein